MIDLGWSEILIIAIVLIVVVGPKDLPAMLRTFAKSAKKMRGMAGDFRKQFDDALSEAELDEFKKTIADVKSLNPKQAIKDAFDPLIDAGDSVKRDIEKTSRSIASAATGAGAAGVASSAEAKPPVPSANDVKLPEPTIAAPKDAPDFIKIAEQSRASTAARLADEAKAKKAAQTPVDDAKPTKVKASKPRAAKSPAAPKSKTVVVPKKPVSAKKTATAKKTPAPKAGTGKTS